MKKGLENILKEVSMEMQFKYKLGTHRQNRRIWIEGKR